MSKLTLTSALASLIAFGTIAQAAPEMPLDRYIKDTADRTGRTEEDVRDHAIDALRRTGKVSEEDLARIGRGKELEGDMQRALINQLERAKAFESDRVSTGLEASVNREIRSNGSKAFESLKSDHQAGLEHVKKGLARKLENVDGFSGVGIGVGKNGATGIRIYVENEAARNRIAKLIGDIGVPCEFVVTGKIVAYDEAAAKPSAADAKKLNSAIKGIWRTQLDGVISGGTLDVTAITSDVGASDEVLVSASEKALQASLKERFDAKGNETRSLKTKVVKLSAAKVTTIVGYLNRVNDYAPGAKDPKKTVARTIWASLFKIGAEGNGSNIKVVMTEAKVADESSEGGLHKVWQVTFVNPKTGLGFTLFMVDGTGTM